MASKGDGDKDKGGKKKEPKVLTKYVTLESESSESDRHPTPTTDPTLGSSESNLLVVDMPKEQKIQSKIPKSASFAATSASKRQSRFKGERTSPPRTRSHRRVSPYVPNPDSEKQTVAKPKESTGAKLKESTLAKPTRAKPKESTLAKQTGPFRRKSKSPLKKFVSSLVSREKHEPEERLTEDDPLLDYEDGVKREEPVKKKKPKEQYRMLPEDKSVYIPDPEPPDDESTSKSSISETSSSVTRATGELNIMDAPESEELKEDDPEVEGRVLRPSASAHAVLQKKPSDPKKDKSNK